MAQMKTLTINGKKYVIVGTEGIPNNVISGLEFTPIEDGTALKVYWESGTGEPAANSVTIPLSTGAGELTEEDLAEIAASVLSQLPITVSEDGYTDISGLRRAVGISVTQGDGVITVATTLEGGMVSTSEITLDDNGYPASIVTDGVACSLSWEGFDV